MDYHRGLPLKVTLDMSLEIDPLFEKKTQYILLKFLQAKKFENRILEEEICKLENEVTEGLAFDDDIQTDGHCPSLPFCHSDGGLEVPFAEELYRDIGARLARMGDGLDQVINRDMVEGFIHANQRIQEDGTITLSAIINGLTNQRTTVVQDMPQEKGVLLLTLLLLEKTVLEQPRLLPRIFRMTVQYITTRLQNYIQHLGGWENMH